LRVWLIQEAPCLLVENCRRTVPLPVSGGAAGETPQKKKPSLDLFTLAFGALAS
jgi:hypothetical protein